MLHILSFFFSLLNKYSMSRNEFQVPMNSSDAWNAPRSFSIKMSILDQLSIAINFSFVDRCFFFEK
jgi:hypothetical protein